MKKRVTFFFHAPAVWFLVGGSVRCIRLKWNVQSGKRAEVDCDEAGDIFFTHLLCGF